MSTTTESLVDTSIERGCGFRQPGGAYIETGLSSDGVPLTHFLCDPPLPIPDDLRLASVGVTTIERDGVTHVVDVVGGEHYPNVADFFEEVRSFGLSRRISKSFPFDKLTGESMIILAHSKAIVRNFADFKTWECPNENPDHAPEVNTDTVCAGIWWEDIKGGTPTEGREIVRKMPSFSYSARSTPTDVVPDYECGFFLALPIGRLVVVNGDGSDDVKKRIDMSRLPTAEVQF
jgi:hypothetical protein